MSRKSESPSVYFGFTPYQWLVLFAAWLGWGFDIFDALLFNFVARLCIPDLLGPGADNPQTITLWTGIITSVLLVGMATGGILFGRLTDYLGRTRTLMLTMLTYALATAACAFAPNIWVLAIFRFIASLGIGGEWAAGAALVAESVPEEKRVQAGALLYTAAPAGVFLAIFVTDLFTRQIESIASNPSVAWRLAFLTGLIPAALAVAIRWKVKEPPTWKGTSEQPKIRELFTPELRAKTVGGVCLAAVALISWWSCNAFLPTIASFLVKDVNPPPLAAELPGLKAYFVTLGTACFNLGGLIGTLLTVPVATRLGRRPMFIIYYGLGALFMWGIFQLPLSPEVRLCGTFFQGLFIFGVFGSFTFYLPEPFPTRLRGTGSGFTYNVARYLTAAGPFIVGYIAGNAASAGEILDIVSWVAIVPAIGAILVILGLGVETKDQRLVF